MKKTNFKSALYRNFGELLKSSAFGLTLSVTLMTAVFGIVIMVLGLISNDMFDVVNGLAHIFIWPIFAFFGTYIVTLPMFGFGEIISLLTEIAANTRRESKNEEEIQTSALAPTPVPAPAVAEEQLDEDDDEESEDSEIEVVCPVCKETLYFNSGVKDAECPFCDSKIVIPEVAAK